MGGVGQANRNKAQKALRPGVEWRQKAVGSEALLGRPLWLLPAGGPQTECYGRREEHGMHQVTL